MSIIISSDYPPTHILFGVKGKTAVSINVWTTENQNFCMISFVIIFLILTDHY